MKNILLCLMVFLAIEPISCKKENATDNPEVKSTFKITKLLPLSDNIPYEALGSGKILFERTYEQGGSSFYMIDIDNKKSSGFQMESTQMTQPSISPDGNRIACSLLKSGDVNANWNIYIMNTDGSDCFPAFVSDKQANFPTWNNDGSKIIFYTSGADGRLYMQSPVENASDREELAKFSYADDPNWLIKPVGGFTVSPTGKLVAVSTSKNLDGLIDIEPFTDKEGVDLILSPYTDLGFVSPDFRVESPVFSPDGSKIAFLSIYTPVGSNYLSFSYDAIDPDGSNRLSLGGMGGYKPNVDLPRYASICWSPDATKVLVSIPDGEKTCHIFVITPYGSGPVQVTNQINVFDSNVSWSR
jgi:Tol biopolymer transport system component